MVSRKVGKLRTKNEKGQDSSQPFPERSLMRGCLSPAHGMHKGMKPDPMTWGYPSEEGRLHFHSVNNKGLPIRGVMMLGLSLQIDGS